MSSPQPIELANPATEEAPEATGGCGGHCTCGADNVADAPVLDVRVLPHEIRHAAIFGALGAIQPGDSIVLLAPHEPVRLIAQLDQTQPGAFTSVLEVAGPEVWQVRLTRTATPNA